MLYPTYTLKLRWQGHIIQSTQFHYGTWRVKTTGDTGIREAHSSDNRHTRLFVLFMTLGHFIAGFENSKNAFHLFYFVDDCVTIHFWPHLFHLFVMYWNKRNYCGVILVIFLLFLFVLLLFAYDFLLIRFFSFLSFPFIFYLQKKIMIIICLIITLIIIAIILAVQFSWSATPVTVIITLQVL